MIRKSIFGLILGGLVLTTAISVAAPVQVYARNELAAQALSLENQARSSNDASSWLHAGDDWAGTAGSMAVIRSQQDWVKDRPNTANREICVALYKRALACLVKSYNLEGEHDNPRSRARSEALRSLSSTYNSLCQVDPTNSSWFYLKGEALSAQGMYKQAEPDLKKAVSLGGAGAGKASALLAHTKPYLAHQLANDHELWAHNEAVDRRNGAHQTYIRPGVGLNYIDFARRQQGQNFNGSQR